jgi:uncharacterized protein (TIGR02246 family)
MMTPRNLAALIGVTLLAPSIPLAAFANQQETAVRALISRNIEGWAKFDPAEIAGTYSVDATWQNPFGVRITGPVRLEQFLKRLFARPGFRAAKDTSPPAIQQVRLLGPDAAAVWSEESSAGQIENGKPLGPRHSHYLQVVHRTPHGWLITDDMIMDER